MVGLTRENYGIMEGTDGAMPVLSLSATTAYGDVGTTTDVLTGVETLVLPILTLETWGLSTHSGEGALSLPLLEMSLDLLAGMVADGEIDLPPPSLFAEGLGGHAGETENCELPALTINASDIETGMVLPMLELDAEGANGYDGELEADLPALELSAVGIAQDFGEAELYLPRLSMVGLGDAQQFGVLETSLPRLQITAQGVAGEIGTGALELPALTVSATGIVTALEGTAGLTLPILIVEGTGVLEEVSQTVQNVVVMNLSNYAISEFLNYPFTGFFALGDSYFGVGPDGIYLLEGEKDHGGIDIETEVEKTGIDLQTPMLKRAADVYLKFRSNGDLAFKMIADKKTSQRLLNNGIEGLRTQKIEPGRGIKGRHLGFNIKNVKGANIRLNELHFLAEILKRRAHDG